MAISLRKRFIKDKFGFILLVYLFFVMCIKNCTFYNKYIFQGKKRRILNNTFCVDLKEIFVFFCTIYFVMIMSVPRYANVHNQNTY